MKNPYHHRSKPVTYHAYCISRSGLIRMRHTWDYSRPPVCIFCDRDSAAAAKFRTRYLDAVASHRQRDLDFMQKLRAKARVKRGE